MSGVELSVSGKQVLGVFFFLFFLPFSTSSQLPDYYYFFVVGCSAWGKDISSVVDKEQRALMSSI